MVGICEEVTYSSISGLEDCTMVGSHVEYLICESGGFIVHHAVISCKCHRCRVECAAQSDLGVGKNECSSLSCMRTMQLRP